MIPLDKLRSVTHLVTHANCPDGIASALIVRDALPDVRVSFVKYGSEEHRYIEPAPGVLFCDFSPWLPRLTDSRAVLALREELIKQWRESGVIVLDHHARDVVEPYGELGVFGENDKLECGAWLAYEHVWLALYRADPRESKPAAPYVEAFARLAAVRDTWKRDDPRFQRARDVGELLFFWHTKLRLSHYLDLPPGKLPLAERLFERAEEHARTSIDEAHRFTTKSGTRVLIFQGVAATSDAAEILEKDYLGKAATPELPFSSKEDLAQVVGQASADHVVTEARVASLPALVVGFHYRTSGGKLQLQFSTRSHTGFDCQAFARAHGGNGHKAAAGFTVEVSPEISGNPYAVFRELLETWEARS